MLLPLLLGLGSGLCWGTADFFGGLQSRRLPALAVAFWSQVAGALGLAIIVALIVEPRAWDGALWGGVAGVFGGLGLLLFYRGLATGAMSIVAPVSACGAVVPVIAALAIGESPPLLALLGIATAFVGIILVSASSDDGTGSAPAARSSILLATGAALGFGLFFVFLDRGVSAGAPPLLVVGGARVASLATLGAIVAFGPHRAPWPGRRIVPVAAVGLADTLANVLFTYATASGNLGVVSVLGSLYPVTTVLLARMVLAERLSRRQSAGVATALGGVALIAAG